VDTKRIYGKRLHPWWPKVFNMALASLDLTFAPPQPIEEQVFDLDLETVSHTTHIKSFVYLAYKQRSRVPYLPISTPHEKKIYRECLILYRGQGKANYNFLEMAKDWNANTLRSGRKYSYLESDDICLGKNIFFKTENTLSQYFNKGLKEMGRFLAISDQRELLAGLNSILNEPDRRHFNVGTPSILRVVCAYFRCQESATDSSFCDSHQEDGRYILENQLTHRPIRKKRNVVPPTSILAQRRFASPLIIEPSQANTISNEIEGRKKRTCRNCGSSSCKGATGAGKQGRNCTTLCSKCPKSTFRSCYGGMVIKCRNLELIILDNSYDGSEMHQIHSPVECESISNPVPETINDSAQIATVRFESDLEKYHSWEELNTSLHKRYGYCDEENPIHIDEQNLLVVERDLAYLKSLEGEEWGLVPMWIENLEKSTRGP
jgi:hypothetical protein